MATLQREVIGNFNTRQEAMEVKQAIEAAGIADQHVMIDDHVKPYNQVMAQGTTVGPEAGLLTGALYGGILGAIVAIIQGYYFPTATLLPGQLTVVVATIVGGIVGAIAAKRIRSNYLPEQKIKGNPDIPRRFRVVVSGDQSEINQARQVFMETQTS